MKRQRIKYFTAEEKKKLLNFLENDYEAKRSREDILLTRCATPLVLN